MDTLIFLLIVVAGLVVAIVMVVRGRRSKANTPQPTWLPPAPPSFAPQAYQPEGPPGGYAKRCPTCRSVYADETLAFCLSDGSTLERVPVSSGQYSPDPLYPQPANRGEVAPTVQYNPNTDPNRK
ncbi:MAG: hypothetical protein QOJ64_3206 [Acidobacteriota bacterium]|nr:hypothetical protein [Acidobacteriota bacterium]